MAINKLTPQYLNSDTDQKLVKSVEMTDNLNVRVSNDDEGTAGVVKNIKGTTVVGAKTNADAFPTGTNRVIASVANETNKEIIFLLYNEHPNRNHGIYKLDMISGKYQKVYEDSVLNFRKYTYTDCDVIVNEENETLFYWTDDVNPPMKVNINRLMRKEYPFQATGYSGTDEDKLLSLTVAKQPPLTPPTFTFVRDSDLFQNNINESLFQFAYQYKYVDGEYSALSEYSKIAFAPAQLKQDFVNDGALNFFNQINVKLESSKGDVEKIILYARRNNEGAWFEVDRVDNTGTIVTIPFLNDKVSTFLSNDEVNKNYDNVPQLAKAQAIVGGRLMYGNYLEGYKNTDLNITSDIVHLEKPNVYEINGEIKEGQDFYFRTTSLGDEFSIGIDFSSIPTAGVKSRSVVSINLSITTNVRANNDNSLAQGQYSPLSFAVRLPDDSAEGGENEKIRGISAEVETYNLPITSMNIKKDITVTHSSGTVSKANLMNQVGSSLDNFNVYCVVDSDGIEEEDATKFKSAKASNVSIDGNIWVSGIAVFKLIDNGNLSSDASKRKIELKFGGARLNVKAAEGKVPLIKNVLQGLLGGSLNAYERLDIVTSGATVIGGLPSFNVIEEYNSNGTQRTPVPTMKVSYSKAAFSGDSSFLIEDLNGVQSFKENASHKFGIVYFDDRGRASGVNKIDSIEVPRMQLRTNKFASHIDLKINHAPPAFAKKWQIVYAGNNEYEKLLQYTSYKDIYSKDSSDESIYISMKGLEGEPNSYKESRDANLEYKFQEGDKLRVIRYINDSGVFVYPNVEFEVLSYDYVSSEEDSPFQIREGDLKAPTGWFLKLKNKQGVDDFDYSSVISNKSKWNSNTLIEIYSPKKIEDESIYYGMGKKYDIVNQKHQGDREVGSSLTVNLTVLTNNTFTSNSRLFSGDTLLSVNATTLTVTSVSKQLDGSYLYTYKSPSAPANTSYTNISVGGDLHKYITLEDGDVYFRLRKLRKTTDWYKYVFLGKKYRDNASNYTADFIEDYSASDFFKSDSISKGKPYAHIIDAKSIRRRSSITYSDAYVLDSDRLNLSSFNLSLANWTDLDIMFGSVQAMVNRGDALTVIQENKASQLPVSRQLLEYASGDAGVSVSKNVLGLPSYYAGDFGTENPESVIERFGVVYYVDYKAAKVIRLSADGITIISDKGMNSFFETEFKKLVSNSKSARVVGGFDPDADEYLVTVEPVFKTTVTIGTDSPLDVPSDINGGFSGFGLQFVDNPVIWGLWGHNWEEFCGNWEDIGNGIVFVDAAYGTQSILVDNVFQGSTGVINVIITDTAYSFSAIGTLDLSTMKVTMPSTTCTGVAITVPAEPVEEEEGFTIAYKHKDGVWGSKYSFRPTMYVNINNELYSFFYTNSGLMWKHNESSTRNNFYGTQYNSIIEAVSNFNPSMIKVFEALGIEGNGVWSGVLTTSDQSTTIGTTDFDEREGHKYSMIFRDTVDSQSNKTYLGKISNVSNNEITFTSPVHKIPFVKGDTLRIADVNSLNNSNETITGLISRNKISVSDDTPFSVDDEIFVKNNARVSGDPMRDVFLKIRITSSDTDAFEVHALSVSFDRSRLHNDKVN